MHVSRPKLGVKHFHFSCPKSKGQSFEHFTGHWYPPKIILSFPSGNLGTNLPWGFIVLWVSWMQIFGRYLNHEGGDSEKSCFEVFGSYCALCKFSIFTVTPFMFVVPMYHIFDKYLTKIFSMKLWTVFHLSQTASDGFNQNWAKLRPLLFVILEIFKTMDRPIVQSGLTCPIHPSNCFHGDFLSEHCTFVNNVVTITIAPLY